MIALLAPGQGAQTPGMLSPWLEDPAAEKAVAGWSDAVGLDLVRLGTTADAEEITDTAVTQPLIVTLGLLAARRLRETVELPAGTVVAGHSIGEITAAAIAGVLTDDAAVALAGVRGREMAAACAVTPTSMAAVLGGDEEVVLARLTDLGLDPANRNGAGQIVAAGAKDAIAELVATPPEGARVREIPVAGAFHTAHMEPARAALEAHASSVRVADPDLVLLSNADGGTVTSGAAVLERLVAQVTRPVRWDLCMASLAGHGVGATLELPPGATLTGMVKRAVKGTPTLAVKTPEQLGAAAELVAEHGK
ncbi:MULTISPECIES: ACP S-malonyltransferase [unclassified Pseudonocardia]|uniref:ACP S-malonyltransferase n=1 Tax=unclassified Pseudonocardia TaxID=2619320 RepID=UPI0001FFE344|nr:MULTISPECIES: ACP S-malonyltransferase [unclassified Pseudonocardia]OLM17336.1 Malonyl CoA-acyl carrier protein transacylase [Pseudonocardia sp. Ae707_Ps1]